MCGISGIFERCQRGAAALLRDLAAMHAPIPHRGPDGEGFALFDASMRPHRLDAPAFDDIPARAAFAFRWLHVQDSTPAGAQPMPSRDGRKWLVFNGEIYNDRELRAELGGEFRSHSDAETILAAYERWDVDCFTHFAGMWSLLLIDLDRRVLIGSRDRFGIRPFFYAGLADRIAFASEIKQLLPLLATRRINDRYLQTFLHRGSVVHEEQETFFAGVMCVPNATHFTLSFDDERAKLDFVRYWDVPRAGAPSSIADIERQLTDSVALTLRTPATTASFLSGGLDSAILTAVMREVDPHTRDLESYSLVFDRERYAPFDESPYIDDFVRKHGTPNLRTTLDAAWLRDRLDDVTRTQEEPLVASAQMAQWRVCELARERGARVVLDGQGADEVFAGYPYHEFLAWQDHLASFDVRAIGEARRLASKYRGGFRAFLLQGVGLDRPRYAFVRGAAVKFALPRNGTRGSSRLERYMFHDIRGFGLRQILVNGDRSGMAHSIETRLPYVDHRLVELAVRLPPSMKAGFGERKRALRAIAATRLPDSMLRRSDKMGFVTPEPLWLRSELRDDVVALKSNARLASLPRLDMAAGRTFIDAYLAGKHNDSRAIWRFMTLASWLEVFDVAA